MMRSLTSSLLLLAASLLFPAAAHSNRLPDGDFEHGLGTWTLEVPDPAATASISTPGYNSGHAFQVVFTAPAQTPQQGVSARIVAPTLRLSKKRSYRLSFATFFDNEDAGFVGVQVNDTQSVTGITVDARDNAQWGHWYPDNVFTFTPATKTVNIKFEFLFGRTSSVDKVDNITLVAV